MGLTGSEGGIYWLLLYMWVLEEFLFETSHFFLELDLRDYIYTGELFPVVYPGDESDGL